MSRKMGGALALASLGALSLLLLNCGSSSSRPTGLLYVISQAQSNVSSFSIDLNNGGLSLINSNATTCSTLTQSPSVNCGLAVSMVLDPTGSSGFVLNQGVPDGVTTPTATCPSPPCGIQPTVYPYTVFSNGSFSPPLTPVTWVDQQDNDTALAMLSDPAVNLMFVINEGTSPSPANCPHQPTEPTSGNPEPDPNDACPSISVFATQSGQTALSLTGNNCAARNNGPCPYRLDRVPTSISVLTFTPPAPNNTQQTLLFMTSNKDLTAAHNDNELSVYSVDSSGNLTELPNSPYTTLPDPEVVLAVNTNLPPTTTGGVFVYVGNQGSVSGSVSAFQVCTEVGSQGNGNCSTSDVADDLLLPVGTPAGAGQNPTAMLVDPTDSFLYVLSYGSSQIFAFRIATETGTLSALTPASAPTGAQPVAMAMHENYTVSGEFIYTSNSTGESITGFSVGATTGSLNTNPTTTLFTPGLPNAMAAR